MRRLFAFIIMALTLLAIAFINLPSIRDDMQQGIEFKGGFEILYQVLDRDGQEYSANERAGAVSAASDVIVNRIDIAGVKNPLITVEGDDMIRVTIASRNERETVEVRDLITSNAEITFRDVDDNLLATAEELLTDRNGAILDYQDGQPVVKLSIKNGSLFSQITSEIASKPQGSNRIVIWLGFQEFYNEDQSPNEDGFVGDSYQLIGQNPISTKKLVSDATVSQTFYGDVIITGSFTQETAANMANKIRAGSINFTLKELSVSSIGASYGNRAFNQSLIAGIVGLSAVSLFMIIIYGLAGLTSAISLIVYVIISLVAFNWMKGEYGPDTIAAMVIAIGMAVDASIISFERTKDELYKGRTLRKAFLDGNEKSLSTILDANITTLIAAFSLYLFGTRTVKGFATMLIISIFFTIVIMVFLSKIMLSFLCQSEMFQNRKNWFGVNSKHIPNPEKGESQTYFGRFANVDFMKRASRWFKSSFGIIGIGLIMALVYQFTAVGSAFNLGLQFSQGTKIYFKTINPEFSTVEQVNNYFSQEGIVGSVPTQVIIGEELITITANEFAQYESVFEKYNIEITNNQYTIYSVSVSYKSQISFDAYQMITQIFEAERLDFYNEAEGIAMFESNFLVNYVSPVVGARTVSNAFNSLLLASLFIIIYIAIRFKFTYAVSAIVALLHDALFVLAIFVIFRIEINIEFISAILAIIGYSINDTIVAFDRLRENIAENRQDHIDQEKRIQYVNKSLQQTVGRSILTTSSTLLTVLALLILGSRASVNFNLAMVFGLLAGTYSSIFIAPAVWLFVERKLGQYKAKRKASAKPRKSRLSHEPEEYVFYGIND